MDRNRETERFISVSPSSIPLTAEGEYFSRGRWLFLSEAQHKLTCQGYFHSLATVTKETTSSVRGHRRCRFWGPESGTAARHNLCVADCSAVYLTLDVTRRILRNGIRFCTRKAAGG